VVPNTLHDTFFFKVIQALSSSLPSGDDIKLLKHALYQKLVIEQQT
jgi:hypothetical protein